MKIASADLGLQSEHLAFARQESRESLRAWRGTRPDFEGMESAIADISEAARRLLGTLALPAAVPPAPTSAATAETTAIEAASEAADNDPFLALVKQMIEFLTGEEVKVFDMQAFSAEMHHTEVSSQAVAESSRAAADGRAGYGIEYDYHALHEEYEETRFSAQGIVRTADGQEIRFSLDLAMLRYHREETSVSIRAGDAVRKDPLVLNFGGTAVELRDRARQFFRFDLDGDGKEELLPLFASGSGYLAFDLDGDGRIDDRRELFGPQTGNGFQELARLDADGNGWIDAADPAFDKLTVWTPAADGKGSLRALADLGVGALALAHTETPFALRGSDNGDLGVVKSAGLYLGEDGRAGSLQEIDLTI